MPSPLGWRCQLQQNLPGQLPQQVQTTPAGELSSPQLACVHCWSSQLRSHQLTVQLVWQAAVHAGHAVLCWQETEADSYVGAGQRQGQC